MMRHRLLKILGTTVSSLAALLVIGVLVWIPGAVGPNYVFVGEWGEQGSAPGQFDDPTGIAVNAREVNANQNI